MSFPWQLLPLAVLLTTCTAQILDCTVDNFDMQPNFNAKAFQGTWYTISLTSSFMMELPQMMRSGFQQKNVKSFYTFLQNNTMEVKTCTYKLLTF